MKQKLFLKRTESTSKMILLIAALFLFNSSFSQTVTPGIRTGLNISNWNLSGVTEVEPLSMGSPDAGVFATLHISKNFSIEPGVTFAYLGSKLKYTETEQVTSKLNYLQVPVVVRYELKNGIAFFAGPQAGFLLKATTSVNDGDKENAKSSFKKNDLSIVSGVEYFFHSGIGIRANYTVGLTDIYDNGTQKITNYSYGVSIAYRLDVAKRTATSKK